MRGSPRRACLGIGVALAACSFTPVVPEDPELPSGSLVDDSSEDFAAHEQLADGVVSPWGRLEPDAFVLGGLHGVAYAGNHVNGGDTMFEEVAARLAADKPLGASYRQLPTNWNGTTRPPGVGLLANDQYTMLYTGEVLLPKGTLTLALDVDDRAIVELALDGATFATRTTTSLQLVVDDAGWYPIRVAYAQGGGNSRFLLAYTVGGVTTPIDGDRLRARVTDHHGLVAFAFRGAFMEPLGETTRPALTEDFGDAAPPFDLGVPADGFSLRYTGQLRIDTAADYTFTAAADDGWRLWLDGELVSYRWNVPVTTQPTATVRLEPGWHDLVVDYADLFGAASFELRMEGGDVPAGPIDPARLRPAVARGLTSASFDPTPRAIGDNTVTVYDLSLGDAPPNAVIESIDYLFGIVEQRLSDLTVTLFDCLGARPLPLDADPGTFYYGADLNCADRPVHAPIRWRLSVADTVPGNDPQFLNPAIQNIGVSVAYHGGGRMPFAPVMTYVSARKATPGATRLGPVTVDGALDGATLEISVRTADDEAALDGAPWVIVANGGNPQVPARGHIQYKLVVTTNGWRSASIDKVELTYFTSD